MVYTYVRRAWSESTEYHTKKIGKTWIYIFALLEPKTTLSLCPAEIVWENISMCVFVLY